MMFVGLRGRKLMALLLITVCARVGAQEAAGKPFASTPEVVTVPAPEKTGVVPSGATPTSPDIINAPAPLLAGPQPNPVAPATKELTPKERTSPEASIVVPASVPGGLVRPAQQGAPVGGPASVPAQEPTLLSAPIVEPKPAVAPEVTPMALPTPEVQREPAPAATPAPEHLMIPAGAPAATPKRSLAAMQTNVVPAKEKSELTRQDSGSSEQAGSDEIAIEEEELVGIDTVDLESPQGNWLFKRLWWERAEEKYEEIRALEAHILELRMPFFMKRTDVDRTVLDPFYMNVAQDRGALEVLLADIAEFLAQEVQEGSLDEQERGIRDQLQAERETLEQLQKNIQAVLSFDHELDSAIGTLMEQLNRVSEYEQEAWAHFKEIGRVLDDKKAREYVLKMKNIHRNIKEIEEYIQERFAIYFDQLIATIKENAQAVTAAMDQLREKGIDLKEQLGQIKEQAQGIRDEIEEEAPRPKVDERGFFERWIISPISSFFGTIWNGLVAIFSWPYNMIFGEEKPVTKRPIEVEEVLVEEPKEESEESSENE